MTNGSAWARTTEMRYIAAGIVFGWMIGFVGAVVAVGSAMLLAKGICIRLSKRTSRMSCLNCERKI